MLISEIDDQPTSQKYFNKLFPNMEPPWEKIYLIVHKVTFNSYLSHFHLKIISYLLHLNKDYCDLVFFLLYLFRNQFLRMLYCNKLLVKFVSF